MKKPKLIIDVDGLPLNKVKFIINSLKNTDIIFKVHDLHSETGIFLRKKREIKIMADPKFYDIPSVVGRRVKELALYNPIFITVHAFSTDAMKEAVANRGNSKILAVTVLTSISNDECKKNFGKPLTAAVLHYARNAALVGVQGIVCSPCELAFLSEYSELKKLKKITPGIRPLWFESSDDQKRITSPGQAALWGSDYLVIGRPIVNHKNPLLAIKLIKKEIQQALKN